VKLRLRLILVVPFLTFVAVLAFGQSGRRSDFAGWSTEVSCSPAPCVLPPTLASGNDMPDYDAPIVANPTNPRQLLVGSNDINCFRESSLGFHLSSDGGSAWSDLCLSPLSNHGTLYVTGFGPILGYDLNGVAYIGGPYGSTNQQVPAAFEGFSKSSDGMNWTAPAVAVGRRDWAPIYSWMGVDISPSSQYVNSVYIASVLEGPIGNEYMNQIVVSHSRDGGATWQQVNVGPIQNDPDASANVTVSVGKNGTPYLAWMYCNSGPTFCSDNTAYLMFSKSSDGGNTWTQADRVATVALAPNGIIPNTDVFVTNVPAIAVDNSAGPHTGGLYIAMYSWTGKFIQVQVVHSTDGGETWSKPVPVAPPRLSVSPTGLVGVSWLDRRNDPNNIKYQAFAGFSADGGLSFQPNVQLTSGFSDPNNNTEVTIGDYTGDTWNGPNYFLAAWMDNSQTTYMQDVVGGIRLK
jgi:hypothetical protein